MTSEQPSFLEWQWSVYPAAHRNRRNLLIHLAAVPVFMGGTVLAFSSPVIGLWALPAGFGAMALAMAAQGKGHRGEETSPPSFRGKLDVVKRIFAEQWIQFPRFVLSGGVAKALRDPGATNAAQAGAR